MSGTKRHRADTSSSDNSSRSNPDDIKPHFATTKPNAKREWPADPPSQRAQPTAADASSRRTLDAPVTEHNAETGISSPGVNPAAQYSPTPRGSTDSGTPTTASTSRKVTPAEYEPGSQHVVAPPAGTPSPKIKSEFCESQEARDRRQIQLAQAAANEPSGDELDLDE